ncbi:MAG: class I SAM-dependent methyltransferase [Parcubacteria group bacterium]|nr:class I SAM-dependent methyltransferase [Parcubacteria group bacterium]
MLPRIKKLMQDQQFYPGLLGIFINPFYLVRHDLFINIRSLAPKLSGKILDVGCGHKPYEKLFINTSSYTGLEFDTPKNRLSKKADIFYDGKKIPFNDSTFDGVILTQVLEHTFNPDEQISEINRVMKKGGYFLVTVPFVWDEHEQPYDYARYSSFGLAFILKKHNFKIIEQRKTISDIRVIFQLINCYIHKTLRIKNYKLRLFFYFFLFSPITILGILFSKILPKNNDLYMDNIILAQKI